MSHTPGPWEIYDRGKDEPEHQECSIESTADKKADWVAQSIYNKSDAHLIAAAPEMLEMLEELEWSARTIEQRNLCPMCRERYSAGHKANCRLGNLLKKARGES